MDKYILLPRLSSLRVDDYSLFSKNWNYNVGAGLNLFIGVNGLGKTTTTSIIIYGLVGFTSRFGKDSFEINEDYFKDRGEIDQEKEPMVTIEFLVGTNTFKIQRLLFDDKILFYELNNQNKDVLVYESDLLTLSRLSKMEDLAFILEKFLIREEEGNYLLWDFREQSRLLQLLISPVGFEDQYQKDAQQLSNLTSEINRKKDSQIKAYNQRITTLKEEKLRNTKSNRNINQINKSIEKKTKKLIEKEKLRENNIEGWKESIKNLDKLNHNIDQDHAKLESLNEKILGIEKDFYHNSYSDKRILTAIHKLRAYDNCIYCDNTVKQASKNIILNNIKQSLCPVCTSPLDSEKGVTEDSSVDISEEINKIEGEIKKLKKQSVNNNSTKENIEEDIRNKKSNVSSISKEIDALKIELLEFELDIEQVNKTREYDIYDIQIKGILDAIKEIRAEIAPKERKAKKLAEKLAKNNNKLSTIVAESLTTINDYFKEYSNKYFRDDCELIIQEKQLKKTNNFDRIRQAHYVPFFEKKKRTLSKHCSTSQRFFLEYLFRLSLLELYKNISGQEQTGFAIFETSEGAFDLKFTNKLADTFLEYSTNNETPLILIVNLSKPDFVSTLKTGMSDSKSILNYIDFGTLSKEDKEFYSEKLKEIKI